MGTEVNTRPSQEEISFYKNNGYLLTNRPLFTGEKFSKLFTIFEEHLNNRGNLKPDELDVPHMKDARLFEFLMAPEILDIVEGLIGPDIGLWSSHFICKEPRTGKKHPGMKTVPTGKAASTVLTVLLRFGWPSMNL